MDEEWPNFRWLDGTPWPSSSSDYKHWGYYMPQNIIEPNNFFGQEYCVGANATEAWAGKWGWADTRCNRPSSYICEQLRKWPWHASPSPAHSMSCKQSLCALPCCCCCVKSYRGCVSITAVYGM